MKTNFTPGPWCVTLESRTRRALFLCLEEAIAEMCKDCPGKKADACNLEDGECIANKWINTLKKARGEK